MTLLLVFVGCLFTIFALWLTVAPFLGADRGLRLEHLDEEVREIEQLVAKRQVLLTSLRELDFDRETDKIAVEDYERFRRRYEAEAVAIMRRLDEIHGGRDWQLRVDQELTERLGEPPQITGSPSRKPEESAEAEPDSDAADDAPPEDAASDEPAVEPTDDESASEDELASEDAADAEDGAPIGQPAAEHCGNCAEALEPDDKFCSQCGTPVMPAEPEEAAASEASA